MSRPRVVITGLGVIASNGYSKDEFSQSLSTGRCGIRPTDRFGINGRSGQAGEVNLPGDSPEEFDRVSQLAFNATLQALRDCGLDPEGSWREEAGFILGTSRGPAISLERFLRTTDSPADLALFREVPFSSIVRNVASRFGFGGAVSTVTMACVSSSLAIGRAMDFICGGRASVMFAGGADALTNLSVSGFSVLRAITPNLCRPFDERRNGMILGEGSGVVVLESLEHATRRGAKVYAELCGWGVAGDAHHPTRPHPEGRGLRQAMAGALQHSGMDASQIDFVNLHGTGTLANDPAECQALHQVFGSRAATLPVNSLKPFIGHTLGAAGVIELIGSLLGMAQDFIAPTLNCEQVDPKCGVDVVRGAGRAQRIDALMSTKSAFGGANVALVARRLPDLRQVAR